jgi:hypothetical protein
MQDTTQELLNALKKAVARQGFSNAELIDARELIKKTEKLLPTQSTGVKS